MRVRTSLLFLTLFATAAMAVILGFGNSLIDNSFVTNQRPADIATGYIDGNTSVDLVVTLTDFIGDTDRVVWYQNDGANNFTQVAIDSTLDQPSRIDVGDVDGDTVADILLVSRDGMYWYENDGAGGFTRHPADSNLTLGRAAVLGDLDHDTDTDIFVQTSTQFGWYENDGSQNFSEHVIGIIVTNDTGIDVADIDGDSLNDLVASVVIDPGPPGISFLMWLENDGGTPPAFAAHLVDQHTDAYQDILADDLDRDGDPDVLACEFDGNDIWWFRNDGNFVFTKLPIGSDFNQAPSRMRVVDIDNDQDRDVVVVGGNSAIGEVVVYKNDGFMGFNKETIDASAGNRQHVAVADADGNSLPDLFVTNHFPFEIRMYLNYGIGTAANDVPLAAASLSQNTPNPFNPTTTIRYSVASDVHVRLLIHDVAGRRVRTLVDDYKSPNVHEVVWDGTNDAGRTVATGIYPYRITAGKFVQTKKMLLLK